MKKFFVMILFAALFISANSVCALNDSQQDKTATKVENADKKENCTAQAGEKKACCADKKEKCTAQAGEKKACCAEKKDASKASCCAKKAATSEAKSSGKKAN